MILVEPGCMPVGNVSTKSDDSIQPHFSSVAGAAHPCKLLFGVNPEVSVENRASSMSFLLELSSLMQRGRADGVVNSTHSVVSRARRGHGRKPSPVKRAL
jgi:hypothetical protein